MTRAELEALIDAGNLGAKANAGDRLVGGRVDRRHGLSAREAPRVRFDRRAGRVAVAGERGQFGVEQRLHAFQALVAAVPVHHELARARGHRVTPAAEVTSALDAFERGNSLDLVISDIGLPDGSGLDLMREIRSRSTAPGIALSGYGMDHDLRYSEEAGFVAHLIKPVDFASLEAAIARVVGGRT